MVNGVPDPPEPFDGVMHTITPGERFYRVASNRRPVTSFNPGVGSPTRFAFFGDPVVPVLYAAETEQAAVSETLLHDIPMTGGILVPDAYRDTVMARLRITRPLRLAQLRGTGLRRLGVHARELTDTDSSQYPRTAKWAQAAHASGFDGLAWTSRMCNDSQAIVLFGDRAANAVELDPTFARVFSGSPGLGWLIDMCAPLRVDVIP